MCLNPLYMYNPASLISKVGGQKYRMVIPCGQCAECRESKRNDMYFRTVYHCEEYFYNDGYVIFDTLTYDNEHLPHVGDFVSNVSDADNFSCFRYDDFRKFIVNLRRQLDYHGYDIKGNFTYFITSEYGSDDEYIVNGRVKKATQRPHYHILFFVKRDAGIEPAVFSRFVSKCWKHGKTDGVEYNTVSKFNSKVFGPRYTTDMDVLRRIANYVSKYVLKDGNYTKMLDARLMKLVGEPKTLGAKLQYKKFAKCMMPRCYWSNGFGLYALRSPWNYELIKMQEDKLRIPDSNQIWRYMPMSQYYMKKLYYETAYTIDGRLYWKLKESAVPHMFESQVKSSIRYAEDFLEFFTNFENNCIVQNEDIEYYDAEDDEIKVRKATAMDVHKMQARVAELLPKYLGDKSPYDFALYVKFYKGRIKSKEQIAREKLNIYFVDDVEEFFRKGIRSVEEIRTDSPFDLYYNYTHSTWNKVTREKCIGRVDLHKYVDPRTDYYEGRPQFMNFPSDFVDNWNKYCLTNKDGRLYKSDEFASIFCINENSDPRFENFDKLYDLYQECQIYARQRKQDLYDMTEDVKRRMKNYYDKNI